MFAPTGGLTTRTISPSVSPRRSKRFHLTAACGSNRWAAFSKTSGLNSFIGAMSATKNPRA